jgi:hypothetical protein
MVSEEALGRNVVVHQLAFDLLAKQYPGFTIVVGEATNKYLGLNAHVKTIHKGTLVSVRAEDPTTKTDTEKEAFYLVVAAKGLETQKEWYVGELDDGEDEVVEVANVSLILDQSAYTGLGSTTAPVRGIFDTSIDRAQEREGATGAILYRQPQHLINLEGGNTLAHSLVFVFPDTPRRNQEQPIRHAVRETTTTLNTSDDKVGPAWSVVYFLVTNAIGYHARTENQKASGEEFGMTAEDQLSAISQGKIDTLKANPTRVDVGYTNLMN